MPDEKTTLQAIGAWGPALGVLAVVISLVAGFVRAEGQINTNESAIDALSKLGAERFLTLDGEISTNDQRLDELENNQLRRRGDVELQIERLRLQQEVQADKLDEVLQLLRSQ